MIEPASPPPTHLPRRPCLRLPAQQPNNTTTQPHALCPSGTPIDDAAARAIAGRGFVVVPMRRGGGGNRATSATAGAGTCVVCEFPPNNAIVRAATTASVTTVVLALRPAADAKPQFGKMCESAARLPPARLVQRESPLQARLSFG